MVSGVLAATADAFPNPSCVWMVIAGEHRPWTTACAGLTNTSVVAGPAVIVSGWLALVSPAAAAKTVNDPASVLLNQKLAVVAPAAMVTDVALVPQVLFEKKVNAAVAGVSVRFTVVVEPVITGLPSESCR